MSASLVPTRTDRRPMPTARLAARAVGAQLGSPLTYLAVAAFYLLVGWLFRTFIISARTADLSPWFDQIEFLLVLVVPVFTMRSFADELRTGAIDLLWVRGVRPAELVAAKFAGSAAFVLGMLVPPLAAAGFVTAGVTRLDTGTFVAQALGAGCVALVLVALGTATSTLSGNPLVAAVVASMAGLFLWFLDLASLSSLGLQRALSLRLHLSAFQVGEVRLEDAVFFAGLIAACLSLAVAALRAQRIRGGDR